MSDQSELTGTWNIDPSHSTVGFTVRHAMISKVHGKFTDFEGVLVLDGENPESSTATLTIQATSIDTAAADRDAHLRSGDFFDVETTPTITFVTTSVTQKTDVGAYNLHGDLTLHGVTQPVIIEVEVQGVGQDPWGNTRIGLEGETEISRKDFGLEWNAALEAGGVLVGDKVTIKLDIEAVKA
jgi:hypothetical protein